MQTQDQQAMEFIEKEFGSDALDVMLLYCALNAENKVKAFKYIDSLLDQEN